MKFKLIWRVEDQTGKVVVGPDQVMLDLDAQVLFDLQNGKPVPGKKLGDLIDGAFIAARQTIKLKLKGLLD